MKLTDAELRQILQLMMDKLGQCSVGDKFSAEIAERRNRSLDKNKPDSFFYEILVRVIHNAGMKAAVVTIKMPYLKDAFSGFDIQKVRKYREEELASLLANPRIIHNRRKLRDCIIDAEIIAKISEKYGSFGNFLSQNKGNPETLLSFLQEFGSVGPAVALDFLKDVGMDFIKPDVHVLRILSRIGLIDSENSFDQAIQVAEQFKQATGEKLIVIDAVFWMYGGGGDGHINKAICNKNKPFCDECPLIVCEYRQTI